MTRRTVSVALATTLLSAVLAVPALGAVACSATGEVEQFGSDLWTYYVTVTWDFEEAAIPERFNLSLEHLEGCSHYDPENPNQQDYIVTWRGLSLADSGCVDTEGVPRSSIHWEGYTAFDDPDCWMPWRHLTWRNDGLTEACDPLPAGDALLRFVSRGVPIGPAMYYDAILIVASDGTCVVCDYFGPLPDCNEWSPAEGSSWSMVKALYR